jgi:hypothetical protein
VIIEAEAHRWKLWQVVDAVRPSQYWHGHYHVRYSERLVLDADGPAPGVVNVEGLADDGSGWWNNAALVDAAGQLVPWPPNELRR